MLFASSQAIQNSWTHFNTTLRKVRIYHCFAILCILKGVFKFGVRHCRYGMIRDFLSRITFSELWKIKVFPFVKNFTGIRVYCLL